MRDTQLYSSSAGEYSDMFRPCISDYSVFPDQRQVQSIVACGGKINNSFRNHTQPFPHLKKTTTTSRKYCGVEYVPFYNKQ